MIEIAGSEATMMDGEAMSLRRELARHARGAGRRYECDLKARAVAWISRCLRAGATIASVSAELGLRSETVRRWAVAQRQSSAPGLARVRVVADARAARTVSVVSPSGFRVDGLELAEAAALLRALA